MEVRSFLNDLRSKYENKNDDEDGLSGVSSNESDIEQNQSTDMDSTFNSSRQTITPRVDESNVTVSDFEQPSSVDMSIQDRHFGNSIAITPTVTPQSEVEENINRNAEDNAMTEPGRKKSAILNKLTGFLYRSKNESPQPKRNSTSNVIIPPNEFKDADMKSSPTTSKSPSLQRGLYARKTEPSDSSGSNPLKHYQGQSSLANDQVLQELSLRHNIDIKAMQSNGYNGVTSATNINSQSANNLTYSKFQPTRQSSEIPSTFQDSNATEPPISQSALSTSELKPNIDLKKEKSKSTDIQLTCKNEDPSIPRSKSANININQYQSKSNDGLIVTKENIPLSDSLHDNLTSQNNIPLSKSVDANLSKNTKEAGTSAMQTKISKSNTSIAYDVDQISFI